MNENVDAVRGRTAFGESFADVKALVGKGLNDPERWQGATVMWQWFEGISDEHPPVSVHHHTPPEPYWVAPMPFTFALPVGGRAPIRGIAAWWDSVTLGGQRSDEAVSGITGSGLRFSVEDIADGDLRWRPTSGTSGHGIAAGLTVYPNDIEAQVWHRETHPRIRQPGLLGSLIPGYAQVKSFSSLLSTQTEWTTLGCRLSFDYIAAVSCEAKFFRKAPLIGSKAVKERSTSRGYGQCNESKVEIEFCDGWHRHRLTFVGLKTVFDHEHELFDFATWLTRAIATSRVSRPYVAPAEQAALSTLASQGAKLERQDSNDYVHFGFTCELPGHRPMSVSLPT